VRLAFHWRCDLQRAAARHRVAGMTARLMITCSKLPLVDLDEPRSRSCTTFNSMFSPMSRRSSASLDQDLGDVEDARLQCLLPRERQQLSNEICRPVGVLFDLHDIRQRTDRPAGTASAGRSQNPIIAVSRLLKSCATPPASCRRLHRLRLEPNWISRFFCSLTSMKGAAARRHPSTPSSRLQEDDAGALARSLETNSTGPGCPGTSAALASLVASSCRSSSLMKPISFCPISSCGTAPNSSPSRAVGFFEPTETIDPRQTRPANWRKIVNRSARTPGRDSHSRCRGQVAPTERLRIFGAGADDALADPRVDATAVAPLQHHARRVAPRCHRRRGIERRCVGGAAAREKSCSRVPPPRMSSGELASHRARVLLTNKKRPLTSTE